MMMMERMRLSCPRLLERCWHFVRVVVAQCNQRIGDDAGGRFFLISERVGEEAGPRGARIFLSFDSSLFPIDAKLPLDASYVVNIERFDGTSEIIALAGHSSRLGNDTARFLHCRAGAGRDVMLAIAIQMRGGED